MPKPKTWLVAGAALALLAGTGAAVAQPKKDQTAEAPAQRHVHVYRGGPGDREHRMAMRHGDPAQHLKDILQLRPEQEPALKAFLDATKREDGPKMVRFEHDGTKTTPERLNDMEARMAKHQAAMKARIDATKAFYAQLDARQKKAFDAMPMLMFAGPGFGPMVMPHHMAHMSHHMPKPPKPPMPPEPPAPPPPPGE